MEHIIVNLFGHRLIIVSDKGKIVSISFDSQKNFKLLKTKSKENKQSIILNQAVTQFENYFIKKNQKFELEIKFIGTDFQKLVWQELLTIPYGQTRTYQEIAESIGKPKAYRAVASAVAKNPVIIIVPCHRVIRTSGLIGQYLAGTILKKELLKLEGLKI